MFWIMVFIAILLGLIRAIHWSSGLIGPTQGPSRWHRTWRAIAPPIGIALIAIGLVFGAFLLMGKLVDELGMGRASMLAAAVVAGAIFGQAKDAALSIIPSSRLRVARIEAARARAGKERSAFIRIKAIGRDIRNAIIAACSNAHSAAFLFRLLGWTALAIAAALISALIASSGTKLTISEGTELTLLTETTIFVPSEGERTLPEGTKIILPTKIEITLPPGIKLIVPTATPGQ